MSHHCEDARSDHHTGDGQEGALADALGESVPLEEHSISEDCDGGQPEEVRQERSSVSPHAQCGGGARQGEARAACGTRMAWRVEVG